MTGCGVVGPFLLLAPLGQGARSRVWRARDQRSGDEVALKLAPLGDAGACARLRNEATLAAVLAHPHIVRLLEAGQDAAAGVAWLSMEALAGTHAALCGARFDELLQALAWLHGQGIAHGDVKPANMLAAPDGSLKLCDFGLARVSAGLGAAHGTPRYMAPERMRGAAPDARSDVFAAGAILFEVVAGRPAFDGAPFDITRQVLAARLAWHALGATPLEPLIRRALAPDRRDRHADAAQLLRAFRSICQRP
jgi:serine/threonine-protein kinase